MFLVDLNKMIISVEVTDELDIIEVISLLLQPDSIMLKNEMYIEDMSVVFKYALQIHNTSIPVIYSKVLVLRRNSVNFMQSTLQTT